MKVNNPIKLIKRYRKWKSTSEFPLKMVSYLLKNRSIDGIVINFTLSEKENIDILKNIEKLPEFDKFII